MSSITINIGNNSLLNALTYLVYIKIALEIIGFIVVLILIIYFLLNNDW